MRVLSPLQTGVLQKPFSFNGQNFFCVSLLWAFRMESGEAVLETEMWQALSEFLKEGRVFDQSMPKDRGEFLCAGSFYAPGGRPVVQEAVSVRVGECRKRLLVTGPRQWRAGASTRPEPITSLPIRYDQAFGGEGFADNPIGKGFTAIDDGNGGTIRPLPCIEHPSEAVTSASQTPRPASFEGMDLAWRPRQRYAGTYDERYLRTRMPGFPDDVDWRLFNDAPEDQWIDGFFQGTEDFELIHMHPHKERINGHLPGVWGRAFIERRVDPARKDSELEFQEIPLRLDTVWLLPDAELGVVIHRGTTQISEDDGTDVVHLLAAHENIGDEPRAVSHYRSEMAKRTDPVEGYRYMLDTRALLPDGVRCAIQDTINENDMQMENLGQKNSQTFTDNQKRNAEAQIDDQATGLRTQLAPHSDQIPEQDREINEQVAAAKETINGEQEPSEQEQELNRIMEKIAPGASNGGQVDITRVDFDAFDELDEYTNRVSAEQRDKAERALRDQIDELTRQNEPPQQELTQAIAEAKRALASMNEPAPLPRPHLDFDLDQIQKQIAGLEEYRAELRLGGVSDEQINASMPDLETVRDQIADVEGKIVDQYREGAHYLEESRSPHPGEETQRRGQLLEAAAGKGVAARGDYAFIDLSGVTIRDLDLTDAYLEYVDFTGARLIGVNLTGAILAKAKLRDCYFEKVDLTDANLGATCIEGAVFEDCDCSKTRFGRARIRESRFERCRLLDRQEMFVEAVFDRVGFIDCEMRQTNFLEHAMTGCQFRGSDLTQSNFLQSDITHADFTGAVLSGVNIVSSRAAGARFDRATMDNVRFLDEPELTDASFREARLCGANLRSADLAGADFTRAVLEAADLSASSLVNASFDRVRAIGVQFRKADLTGANLYKADLREASLMKAKMLRARFTGANLYSVSFLFSTLGETEFLSANLDNTILRDWRPRGG